MMKTAGIIAEYNPFHEGHRYHIRKTREETGADYVIVVMSGDFVQRGEPAIVDKYVRTGMALQGGADLVIELPVIYATASAEYFASAGVDLLNSLGLVDVLSFGSEWAGTEDYRPLVDLLTEEPEEYKEVLREALASGYNFPTAREIAVKRVSGDSRAKLLKSPNHILGLEYMKALKRTGSSMAPLSVIRKGAGYHQENLDADFASSTAIRREADRLRKLREEQREEEAADLQARIEAVLGETGKDFLRCCDRGETVDWDDLMRLLDYQFIFSERKIGKYFGMDRDISRRIRNLYEPNLTFAQLVDRLHGRQLTDTALKRALLHMLLKIKDISFLYGAEHPERMVPYARVLGFRKSAAPLLGAIRERAKIPVIQRPAPGRKELADTSYGLQLYDLDIRSATLYEQVAARKGRRAVRNEYRREQIIID